MYRTYKISNSEDNRIYYGSTKLDLQKRMECHRAEARKGNPKLLSEAMRALGIDKFHIEPIDEAIPDKLHARMAEQKLIDEADPDQLLNAQRAYTWNPYYTCDRAKLLAKKKRYYYKKLDDQEWVDRQRERGKIKMQKKRAFEREVNTLMMIEY